MKIAISTATYFADAIIDLLGDAGYETDFADGRDRYILVNTTKLTARDGNYAGNRQVLCPTSQWAAIAALVNATDGGAQAAATGTTVAAVRGNTATDAAGNPLAIGDTVLVTLPAGKKPVFTLRPNGVAVITRITSKGALGFAFDEDNEFLSKRFQKVTLTPANAVEDYDAFAVNIQSGDLVVARPGRHSRNAEAASKFALPTDTALVFRGVTVDKGNFILDGYADHQYSPSRFSVVTPV